jgi:hypothetical protein
MMHFFQSLIATDSQPPTPQYDSLLVYLGGQSNGEGVGAGPPVSPYDAAITGCNIWTGSAFATLQYNVNNEPANVNEHGCELSLGYKLNELFSQNIYMVKFAVSSTAIDQLAGEQDFNPNSGEYYPQITAKVNAAYNHMKNTLGLNPLVVSIWLQGERDARLTASSAIYDINFNLLKSSFASDVFNSKWWLNVLGTPR